MANFTETIAVSSRIGGKNTTVRPGNADLMQEHLQFQEEHLFDVLANHSRILLDNKRRELNLQEGNDHDCAVLAAESSTMPLPAGPGQDETLTYVSAASFGRKNGAGVTTVLTYADIPSPGKACVETGYIEVSLNDRNEKTYAKKPRMTYSTLPDTDMEAVERYTSGINDEVMRMAETVSRFEHEVEPVMQRLVANHPFNTLSFYNGHASMPKAAYYGEITSAANRYFIENGGNCVLFTLQTARELDDMGLQFKVALIPPSEILPSGHTALIVTDRSGRLSFFVDPGLSLTQPIALSGNIPVYPFAFDGSKQIFVSYNNEGSPSVRIHTKKAKSNLVIEKPVAYQDFLAMAPSILEDMDKTRTQAKLDYHRPDGTSVFSCTLNLDTDMLSIRGEGFRMQDIPVDSFLADTGFHTYLGSYLTGNGISFDYLLQQLAKRTR